MKPALLICAVAVAALVVFVAVPLLPTEEGDSAAPAGSIPLSVEPVFSFRANAQEVTALALSPDGRFLATTSPQDRIYLWRATDGASIRTISDQNHWTDGIAFAPDGRLLATGSRDGKVTLWDAHTGAERASFGPHTGCVWSVAFSPDGRFLAAAAGDLHTEGSPGEIKLWDVTAGTATTLDLPSQAFYAVAFSPDGTTLAAGVAVGREVVLWDMIEGRERRRWPAHAGAFLRVSYSPDGRWLATASTLSINDQVVIWRADDGVEQVRVRGLSGVRALAWAPDSRLLAAAGMRSSAQGVACEIWLLNPDGNAPVRRLRVPPARVQPLAFTPDGASLLGGCSDGRIRGWTVAQLGR